MDAQSLRSLGIRNADDCNAYTLLTSCENNSKIIRILRDFVAEYNASVPLEKITVRNAGDAVKAAGNIFKGLDHEQCWVLFLNNGLKVTGKKMISDGTLDSTLIDNRSIAVECLNRNASGVILMHNHPSGDPTPSKADISQTEKLKGVLNVLDMTLYDHIVISENSYFSFADEKTEKFIKS